MHRRQFLRAGAGLALATPAAGCLSRLGFGTRSVGAPPVVEDRPDAVYVPSHVEGMEMVGTAEAGPYGVALFFSYPHRFWLVTGEDVEKVEIADDDSVHLMASLWDRETSAVVPTGSLTLEVSRDGEQVLRRPPWPMLSQNMGFHFGDNLALPGEGTYDVAVEVGPIGARRTGAFRDRFGESASAEFSFEFSRSALQEIDFRRLDDRKGERGAVDPMEMGMMPTGQLPPPGDLPGRAVGEAAAGDGQFVVRALDSPPAGVDGPGAYLAVSARTPYNRYPLPFMSISASLGGDGGSDDPGPLTATLDPDLGYHYGTTVGSIESGDTHILEFGAPPQVSRHEGYETAFLRMEPASIGVE